MPTFIKTVFVAVRRSFTPAIVAPATIVKVVCVKVWPWFRGNSAAIVAIATIVLTILTFFYLQETRGQRSLAEEAISLTRTGIALEHSPKVYIKSPDSRVTPDYDKNQLVVHSTLAFLNCGRSEAKGLSFSYVVVQGGKVLKRSPINEYEYIYPGQTQRFELERFRISVNPESMRIVRQAQGRGDVIKVPLGFVEPIFLEMSFSYDDLDGNTVLRSERFKYVLAEGRWVLPASEASN